MGTHTIPYACLESHSFQQREGKSSAQVIFIGIIIKEQNNTVRKYLIAIPISGLLSLALLLAGCGNSGGASSSTSSSGKEAAATVNGTTISVEEVDRITKRQAGENPLSPLELASARLQVLDELIQQEVLFQRAQKDGINPTDQEINEFIQKQKQEAGMTEEEFDKQLKGSGQTQEGIRADIRKQMAIQKLQDKLGATLKVQDREITDFFKSNPQQFVAEPGVAVADIIVDPADNGMKNDAKDPVAAQAKINDIMRRLNSGTDFATVARGQSEDQSALQSGDLPFIPQTQFAGLTQAGLPADIGARLMAMSEGDRLGPLKDQRGRFHIFKLTQKRTERRQLTAEDPEVRKQISDYILNQRRALLNAALLTRARDESKIDNVLAKSTYDNPNSFGVLRPVSSPAAMASPAAAASPQK
jgi:peptidyl-prolyl cis-trans isomerase SurA